MDISENLFYTKEHEWARIEGKKAYIGITEYATHSLGDITFVQLPKVGQEVKQGAYCSTVESVKAASEVYSPLSGKVLSVNEQLSSAPELVNQSPYEKGYFFCVEIADESEKTNLMDVKAYQSYLESITK